MAASSNINNNSNNNNSNNNFVFCSLYFFFLEGKYFIYIRQSQNTRSLTRQVIDLSALSLALSHSLSLSILIYAVAARCY